MFTNLATYRAIAVEALARADEAEQSHRRPRTDGQLGDIVSMDPTRTSFKQSLVAIAFVGIYLDALLFVVGTESIGVAEYTSIDRKPYEERLKRIAVIDQALLAEVRRFRELRNDLVHEKAAESLPDDRPIFAAQREARRAIELMIQLEEALPKPGRRFGARIAG